MRIPIFRPRNEWECPNCDQTDSTTELKPHTRFHSCPGMGMLTAPFVPAGTSCQVIQHEREDYVGNEHVTYNDQGRPIMSIETVREDGNDIVAFAPCAVGFGNQGRKE